MRDQWGFPSHARSTNPEKRGPGLAAGPVVILSSCFLIAESSVKCFGDVHISVWKSSTKKCTKYCKSTGSHSWIPHFNSHTLGVRIPFSESSQSVACGTSWDQTLCRGGQWQWLDPHWGYCRGIGWYMLVSIVMGVPQNGWFIREHPIKMDDWYRGTSIFGIFHMGILWDIDGYSDIRGIQWYKGIQWDITYNGMYSEEHMAKIGKTYLRQPRLEGVSIWLRQPQPESI